MNMLKRFNMLHTNFWLPLLIIILYCHLECVNCRRDIVYASFLDNRQMRSFYRTFRDIASRLIGQTGWRTKGSFLQGESKDDFPCNVTGMRSETVPNSVHKLRPGDIDIIAALGDSLTAASGASSVRIPDVFIENRGLSWSIGGQWNWRNSTTLPNILRVFNPSLTGYSKHDSFTSEPESQLNLAEIGASSADMPYMAKQLVQRIKTDRRVNFKKTWKMVTIAIGGNDMCSFICTMDNPESLPRKHKQRLIKTLRYLRDYMPRTFVNIVPVPYIKSVVLAHNKPTHCDILHHGECACWIGHLYNQNKETQERYHKIQLEIHRAEESVTQMKEFRGLKEFAAVFQPWPEGLDFEANGIRYDYSLLAVDCFHMSQKGHGWAGVALWNNLLEMPGQKSVNWVSPKTKFLCPTEEQPYLFTYDNYLNNNNHAAIANLIDKEN